ncbi:MAG: hypothetical protein J5367_01070 [Lachnospiraceae bacterium]|nr:hypothetical protein [Lachnospiraceae bacterium]
MKKTDIRKIITVLLLTALVPVLCGADKKNVKLLRHNLIDLDKAIELAEWGGDTRTDESGAEETSAKDDDKEGTAVISEPVITSVKVIITGKTIKVDGIECSPDELAKKIEDTCNKDSKVFLIDDYAEAHVYRSINDILLKEQEKTGFSYEAD